MATTRTFEYEAVDATGKRGKGTIEATNETAAAQTLRQQGAVPLSIAEQGALGLRKDLSIPGLSGRTTLKDLSVFSRQFATLSTSGMSLLRSLAVLEEQTAKPGLRRAVGEVRADIEGGVSLSAAMAKHDRVFPTLMIAMIRAGETGGVLEALLDPPLDRRARVAASRFRVGRHRS